MIRFGFGRFSAFKYAIETKLNIFSFKKLKIETERNQIGPKFWQPFGQFFQFVSFVHTPNSHKETIANKYLYFIPFKI